jgi:peptidoglycan/xylan/chitin deacetylase (PgdA/CDA1 family)
LTFTTRRILIGSAAAIALLVAIAFTLFEISRARCFSLTGEAICHVETDASLVALTFDDGPTPEGVAWATSVLRPAQAHATFFLIGSEIGGRESLVRQLLAEGHEIGNHSFSHVRMVLHLPSFYEVRSCGRTPCCTVPA